ncbi:MAG: TlpA family protein disulfide reductase [Elusimicrobia bacterium]|nr:TlpA family protein disulfide reductase [Elusimicrobiota bacterium]
MNKAWGFLAARRRTLAGVAFVLAGGYWIGVLLGPHTQDFSEAPRAAADFALPDLSGKTVRLSDFKGRVVLVDFWATWCAPCLEELPDLKALYSKRKDLGFTIVGISIDDEGKEVVAPFVDENQVPYPILIAGLEPVGGFPVRGLPTAYLIDRRGFIVKKYIGFKFPEQLDKDVSTLLSQGADS